jgi:hypothetical protein
MTPQTLDRRMAMIGDIITDMALGHRFDDKGQPATSEKIKVGFNGCMTLWNETADRIDKWAAKLPDSKFADGFVGLRLRLTDAWECKFCLTDKAIRTGAKLPGAYWRAIGELDRLAEHVAKGSGLTVPVWRIQWMADFIFISMINPEVLDRAAHTKGHVWDRRLRHAKRAKARKAQAFYAEAALALEDTRQEREFQELLRDTVRRHHKMQADIRSDPRSRDVDVGPPQVKRTNIIVHLKDHRGLMLMPPVRGGRRVLPKKPQE